MIPTAAVAHTALTIEDGAIRWGPLMEILGTLPIGTAREVQPVSGMTLDIFMQRLRAMLYAGQYTRGKRFIVGAVDGIVMVRREHPRNAVVPSRNDGEPRALAPRIVPPITGVNGVVPLLLDKLPDFNPAWPEAVQQKWFEAFEEVAHILIPSRSTVIR